MNPLETSSKAKIGHAPGHYWPYGLAAGIIAVDQLTKLWAENSFGPFGSGKEAVIVPGWLRFTLFKNTGASFGFLNDTPWVFTVLATAVVIGIVVWYEFDGTSDNWQRATLGMILAGATGNLLDRLFKSGAVTDFINIPNLEFAFRIFNVADSSLTLGVATLLIYTLYRTFVPVPVNKGGIEPAEKEGSQVS